MSGPKITIIDTGCANLTSVNMALVRLGADVCISREAEAIRKADKLILPGVGTAVAAMKNLEQRGLVDLIREAKQPLMGICLGMQMLSALSEESMDENTAGIDCLGIVDARVRLMQVGDLRLPHMGWNQIIHNGTHPLFEGIAIGSYFYFVHSYAMEVNPSTIATCHYANDFTAVVQRDNFYGAQFHPEKSGAAGARFLKNFIEL